MMRGEPGRVRARRDVLPVGDLGIVRAIQKAYRLRRPPGPARIRDIGERWRPRRSVAAWYLWASRTTRRGRVAVHADDARRRRALD